ncbi:MAG: ankyrin repeat domain-containing protein, partial [Verrucomicrobia bacterium]|nr:ankyrin repeat domain-containing protein [Verrucomicrobiota bacterium]
AVVGGKFALDYQSSQSTLGLAGTNAIHSAASGSNVVAVRRLLEANPRLVNQRDANGTTPLLIAAAFGQTEVVRLLLSRGAVVSATNAAGFTALLQAAAQDHPATVRVLLEAGADPNQPGPGGATALFTAALVGSTEATRILLAAGAKPDLAYPESQQTALHVAAMRGFADVVELLLAHDAQVNRKDRLGAAPLHYAARAFQPEDFLRLHGQLAAEIVASRPDYANAAQTVSNQLAKAYQASGRLHSTDVHEYRRIAELLLARHADIEVTNADGCTPLLWAALSTNLPVAEVLVAQKANLNARARDGSTPLNLAALKGSVPVVELLLKAGANANLQDATGFTALNTAAEHGHIEVMRQLLVHGANPNLACPGDEASTVNGQAPMHSAAIRGDVDMLRLLLDKGASLNLQSKAGTPLCWAVRGEYLPAVELWLAPGLAGREHPYVPRIGSDEDHVAVLKLLLTNGADVNGRDLTQRTPLMVAVRQGNVGAVDTLLAAGADRVAADQLGFTALQEASELDAPAQVVSNVVTRLLRAGAPLEARDLVRRTPLHQAAYDGKPVVAALLLKAGARKDAVGPDLRTPLLLAVIHGSREVVELLLARRADPEWRDIFGSAALHYAAQLGAKEIATLLLDHSANVNLGTTDGSTALMAAAQKGDLLMIKLLLERGAKINTANQND